MLPSTDLYDLLTQAQNTSHRITQLVKTNQANPTLVLTQLSILEKHLEDMAAILTGEEE